MPESVVLGKLIDEGPAIILPPTVNEEPLKVPPDIVKFPVTFIGADTVPPVIVTPPPTVNNETLFIPPLEIEKLFVTDKLVFAGNTNVTPFPVI